MPSGMRIFLSRMLKPRWDDYWKGLELKKDLSLYTIGELSPSDFVINVEKCTFDYK